MHDRFFLRDLLRGSLSTCSATNNKITFLSFAWTGAYSCFFSSRSFVVLDAVFLLQDFIISLLFIFHSPRWYITVAWDARKTVGHSFRRNRSHFCSDKIYIYNGVIRLKIIGVMPGKSLTISRKRLDYHNLLYNMKELWWYSPPQSSIFHFQWRYVFPFFHMIC